MVDASDVALWGLVGTWILVVGTLLLMFWQTRSAKELNSANAVMALRERFDGSRMRAARRHLSDHLLKQSHDDIASMEVITFFELVGALTHRGILDEELVWEAFGSWATSYYWAVRHPVDLVGKLREDLHDPLVFHEFEWLSERIAAIDDREVGVPSVPADTERLSQTFLDRETKLGSI